MLNRIVAMTLCHWFGGALGSLIFANELCLKNGFRLFYLKSLYHRAFVVDYIGYFSLFYSVSGVGTVSKVF